MASRVRDPIGVYDARWREGEFSDGRIRRLFAATMAYGRELGVDTIALTRDGRLAAAQVMELALGEAWRQGMRVCLCADPISTPQSYFTALAVAQEHPKTMGLTITASHNPPGDIGVKFTVPVVRAIGERCGPRGGLTRVRELYHERREFAARPGGSPRVVDYTREYIDFAMKQAGVGEGGLAGLSVVLDCLHGAAGPAIIMALARAGVEVHPLRFVSDGRFPDGAPNPILRGRMDRAIALAKEGGCQAVLGLDGDGDRIVFGDGRGILTAGLAFVPILRACAADDAGKPAPVLHDPKVSPIALAEWGELNVRPLLFRNGHSQIKNHMLRTGAVAAVEESGHYYHRLALGAHTICAENSVLTILLFLAALKREPGLMDRLWSLQERVATTGEFNYEFRNDRVRDRALAAVVRHFKEAGAAAMTKTRGGIDLEGTCLSRGVAMAEGNVQLRNGWYSAYIRASTTERGVARLYFSTGEPRLRSELEAEARRIMAESGGVAAK